MDYVINGVFLENNSKQIEATLKKLLFGKKMTLNKEKIVVTDVFFTSVNLFLVHKNGVIKFQNINLIEIEYNEGLLIVGTEQSRHIFKV